ncbi:class I SAM-dependent methyltransferase [Sphingomonas psychrotolerans]|nr:class I SAM-dependent methyltransferase [Sphingomonas psychrotolerans]
MLMQVRLETVDCPCCESKGHRHWASENGYDAVKCTRCGTVYIRERPRREDISAAARDGVHPTEDGVLDQRLHRQGWKVPFYAGIVRRFFEGEKGLRWLDVGAGNGEFVEAVQRALPDAEAMGIDPMKVKVACAQKRSVPITAQTLEEVTGSYDVISIINVFSHIPDFQHFGRLIRARLKPGGSLFIETGNGGDLPSRADYPGELLLPDHLVFSGIEQMKQTLGRLGFGRVEHFSRRTDHPLWAAKQMVKGALKGRPRVFIPWTRKFRTIFYRAYLDG